MSLTIEDFDRRGGSCRVCGRPGARYLVRGEHAYMLCRWPDCPCNDDMAPVSYDRFVQLSIEDCEKREAAAAEGGAE